MCRIAGFWDRDGDEATAIAMRDALAAGGPDGCGLFWQPARGLALGHRRLAILDLSVAGHQPMTFGDMATAYTGEIYNFREIRRELAAKGYTFTSETDTEVLLKGFHSWGLDVLARCRGMWAFALWDGDRLWLVRDALGVKPLYYRYTDGRLAFASELKAFFHYPRFQPEIDPDALTSYLQYGYVRAPRSIWQGVSQVLPGEALCWGSDGTFTRHRYWDVLTHLQQGEQERAAWLARPAAELEAELTAQLQEAFALRLVADVPVGVFLSGGTDSSLVAALLQERGTSPLKTFTIGFVDGTDEAPAARAIAQHLGTAHAELYCTEAEAQAIVPLLPEVYDEPLADSSVIPTVLLARWVRSQVTVALSADGGDEQFYGYPRYARLQGALRYPRWLGRLGQPPPWVWLVLSRRVNLREKYAKLQGIWQQGDRRSQYETTVRHFLDADLQAVGRAGTGPSAGDDPELSWPHFMAWQDIEGFLAGDILPKVDRATMHVALEGREPFLDRVLVEYTSRLPPEFKYPSGQSKYRLRRILGQRLPLSLLKPGKVGFGAPIAAWLRGALQPLCREYLDPTRLQREGWFCPQTVQQWQADLRAGRTQDGQKLWSLLVFQLWQERWGGCGR
ncbi:MAG TPA: asparagine synthase (glutamine-hydrolyzing) [Cyanobacteria bacterium UBA8156]|nr:asparagine synthase (glutamine-hydrolyzing) [Cyanobacteria bacterium UBA8156]